MARTRWFLGSLTVVIMILTSCLSFPMFFGYGPWLPLPSERVPSSQSIVDERFAEAANISLEALKTHRIKRGIPGLTAAVAFEDTVVWTGASGWADIEARTPVHQDTVMRIGSTSKAVTATALARLIDSGEMTLDDPISNYSEDWPNPEWRQLTPRQLASHTAGFPEYNNNGDPLGKFITLRGTRHYSTVRETLEIFDDTPLLFAPGTDFAYSSFGVNLLGVVIAESQNRSFLSSLNELVFSPLGLESSGGDHDGIRRPHLARFYQSDGDRCRIWKPFDLSQRWPGGGLVSTSSELAILGINWLNPDFIRPETRKTMWTPQALATGQINEQQYAIGWRFYSENQWPGDPGRKIRMAHHGGISKGAMSWLVVYPDYQLSIALNANARLDQFADFNEVEGKIAASFLSTLENMKGVSGLRNPPPTRDQ